MGTAQLAGPSWSRELRSVGGSSVQRAPVSGGSPPGNQRWYNVSNGTALASSPASASPAPPPVIGGAIASDGGFGTPTLTVLFGGTLPSGGVSDQTWVYVTPGGSPRFWFNGTNQSDAPPPLTYATLTFDPRIPAFVLFGGVLGDQLDSSATWFLNESSGVWTNYSSNACAIYCPAQRSDAGMAFAGDSGDDATLLFGGCSNWVMCYATALNDTWVLDQYLVSSTVYYAWIPGAGASAPSPRYDFGMAFGGRGSGDAIVLFGGCEASSCSLNDTWTYLNGTWTNQTASLAAKGAPPPGRTEGALAYDGYGRQLLLVGGFNETVNAFNDTWTLACSPACAWSNKTATAGGVPEFGGIMPSNASSQDPLLFGGYQSGRSAPSNGTWVFQPTTGYSESIAPKAPEIGEPTDLNATLLGGSSPDSAFVRWTFIAPNQSTESLGGNVTQRFELAGSWVVELLLIDLNGVMFRSTTEIRVLAPSPLNAVASPPATDVGHLVVLKATVGGNATAPYNFSWTFSDRVTLYGQNVSRSFSLPGSYAVELNFRDAYSNTSVNLTEVVHGAPFANVSLASSSPRVLVPVNFSSVVTNGTPGFAYSWSFGDGATSAVADPVHSFGMPGAYTVRLNVTDAVGAAAPPVVLKIVVGSGTPLAASARANVSHAPRGGSIEFTASASGGAPPYVFRWLFGDGASAASSPTSHAFSQDGSYRVQLWVNDSEGASVRSSVVVTIGAPPASGGSFGGIPGWDWVGIGAAVIVALAAVVVLRWRSHRPPRTANQGTDPPTNGP
jgi:hypothetical protein